ncbi:hypothetical protein HWD35_21015 [Tsukamurella tyrosinosolvens]|uniref:hypothetical protein n=1 Tax=Tsukamurella tyrosinosolvens TaxID=57704 RepID=UPI001CE098DF|nr:hypothetical protein [Tsukamurella tyrosinosolvens]MCA4997208.1 hypothetical protein [Tsukamurella tyrosinosolvens]
MTTTIPSREEYEEARAMLAGRRGVATFDENYTAEDLATARAWVAEYEAANR